jgi:hypothetical protein
VFRFVGPGLFDADVLCLLVAQYREIGANAFQVQSRDFLIEVLR